MSARQPFRRPLSVAVVALSCLGLSVSAASAASAQTTGFIDVQNSQVVSPQTNVGLVSVVIADSSPLTSMTVSLFQNGADKLDLPMSDFTTPSGDGNGQFLTWTLKSPITTGQLPLGVYDAQVSAIDMGGDTVTAQEAGALFFQNEVLLSAFKSNGTRFSFDQPNVTFTGTAALLAPGGSPSPFANGALVLTDTSSMNTPVTTDSSGAFTVTVKAQTTLYQMEYPGNAQTETAFSATLPISVDLIPLPIRIHAALAHSHVNYGARDSVSGFVTYADKGVTKPLPGQSISLYEGSFFFGETPTATTVTGGGGKFSMPVPTNAGVGSWTVAISSSPYFIGAQVILQITIAEPNRIGGFQVRLNSFAVVTYFGCINASTGNVVLQYAPTPTGPWRTIGKTPAFTGTGCTLGRNIGNLFSGQAFARLAGAYYRTRYFPTLNWQGAVSKSTFLHKFLTKITSFNVTPRSVPHHGRITVSGRLWTETKSGRWRPYAHRQVIVVFRFQGVFYRYPHAPETNSAGRFSGSFEVFASSPFFAQYNGDSTHFASASQRIKVSSAVIASTLAPESPSAMIPLGAAWVSGTRMLTGG